MLIVYILRSSKLRVPHLKSLVVKHSPDARPAFQFQLLNTAVCAYAGKDKEAQHRCAVKLGQQFEVIKGSVEQNLTS